MDGYIVGPVARELVDFVHDAVVDLMFSDILDHSHQLGPVCLARRFASINKLFDNGTDAKKGDSPLQVEGDRRKKTVQPRPLSCVTDCGDDVAGRGRLPSAYAEGLCAGNPKFQIVAQPKTESHALNPRMSEGNGNISYMHTMPMMVQPELSAALPLHPLEDGRLGLYAWQEEAFWIGLVLVPTGFPVSRSVTEASRFQRSTPVRPRSEYAYRVPRGAAHASTTTRIRGSQARPARPSARALLTDQFGLVDLHGAQQINQEATHSTQVAGEPQRGAPSTT